MTMTAYILVCFYILTGQGGDHSTTQETVIEYRSMEYDNLKNDLMKDITILDAMIKDGKIDDDILKKARMKLAIIQDAMNKNGITKDDIFQNALIKDIVVIDVMTKSGHYKEENFKKHLMKFVMIRNVTIKGTPVDLNTRDSLNRMVDSPRMSPPVSLELFSWGDYSRLQHAIRMNRPGKYKLGEPIFICGYVKNMSGSDVNVYICPIKSLFSANIVSLKDADGNDVPMTQTAKLENGWLTQKKMPNRAFFLKDEENRFFKFLKPCEEIELKPGVIVLNRYFDLTRPGLYSLTFHRITFHERQRYKEPLVSNTLTFEVLDELITPDDLRDSGEFNWPPREIPAELSSSAQLSESERPVE